MREEPTFQGAEAQLAAEIRSLRQAIDALAARMDALDKRLTQRLPADTTLGARAQAAREALEGSQAQRVGASPDARSLLMTVGIVFAGLLAALVAVELFHELRHLIRRVF